MLTALILGGAESVFADAEEALKLFPDGEPDAFFAINDTFPRWPGRVDYFCSLHPDKVGNWLRARESSGYPLGAEVWSYKQHHGARGNLKHVGIDKITHDWGGSSGLFAVHVALEEKFKRIVLAGVPMDRQGKHLVRHQDWTAAVGFRNAWKKRFNEIKEYTRSMGGWTKEILGAPTPEWIRGQ